jgi:hypothetical protein
MLASGTTCPPWRALGVKVEPLDVDELTVEEAEADDLLREGVERLAGGALGGVAAVAQVVEVAEQVRDRGVGDDALERALIERAVIDRGAEGLDARASSLASWERQKSTTQGGGLEPGLSTNHWGRRSVRSEYGRAKLRWLPGATHRVLPTAMLSSGWNECRTSTTNGESRRHISRSRWA